MKTMQDDTSELDLASQIAVQAIEETDEEVQELANSSGCALLSFVAPYVPVRRSPITDEYASVGVQEEFGVESFIDACVHQGVKSLHLLVNSPGGGVTSSYKVARALRLYFDQIRVFVPHIAASGGTMIALTGNEIVMGIMSNLTPIDVQVRYKGGLISTTAFLRSFERFTDAYAKLKMTPDEAPYTLRAMAEQLDPLLLEEMLGANTTCAEYIQTILEGAGHDPEDARSKAEYLTTGFRDHGTVLDRDLLISKAFKVAQDKKYPAEWRTMRHWLKKYISKSGNVHHMTYCLPKRKAPQKKAARQKSGSSNSKPRRSRR